MMHANLVRMKTVGLALKDLKQDYLFIGGDTVALYATNSDLASEVRPTDDVDLIVELATYRRYSELDEGLNKLNYIIKQTLIIIDNVAGYKKSKLPHLYG